MDKITFTSAREKENRLGMLDKQTIDLSSKLSDMIFAKKSNCDALRIDLVEFFEENRLENSKTSLNDLFSILSGKEQYNFNSAQHEIFLTVVLCYLFNLSQEFARDFLHPVLDLNLYTDFTAYCAY